MNIIDALEELAVTNDIQVRFGCKVSEHGAVTWSAAAYRESVSAESGSNLFAGNPFVIGHGPTLHGALTRMLEQIQ